MAIFCKPDSFEQLCALVKYAVDADAYDELHEYAVNIARSEGYADCIEQANCWLEDAPYQPN